jgi:putative addiction module component (TIGR02574 family)
MQYIRFLKMEIAEKYDHWEDDDFVKELDARLEAYESGEVQGIPWEEVKRKAREKFRDKHPDRLQ